MLKIFCGYAHIILIQEKFLNILCSNLDRHVICLRVNLFVFQELSNLNQLTEEVRFVSLYLTYIIYLYNALII